MANSFFRLVVTLIAFLITGYIAYKFPLGFIDRSREIGMLREILSLILAVGVAYFIWLVQYIKSSKLKLYLMRGGLIVGIASFLIGYIGPIIFYPSANQGPLLGIFITGPLGFFIGIIVGGIYWQLKANKT